MTGEPRPAVRAVALLFSMAVAGGLIGFGWERFMYEAPADVADQTMAEDVLAQPVRRTRTPEQEEILRRALSHFPPYPRGTRPEVLAADYLGADVPIAVAWFSTQDRPDQVLAYYNSTLLDAGLPTVGDRQSEHAGYVGYWSPASEEVHLVSVMEQGGETLVFVSSGRMARLLEGPPKVPQWIPLPPDAEDASALTFKLEGGTQYTVSARVAEGSVPEVMEFFQKALGERGWSVQRVRDPDDFGVQLDVRRGEVRGMVMLRRQPPAPEVMIYLSLTERMRVAPQEGSPEETKQ
jgi:hypothetical protein